MAKTFDGPPTLERSGSEHRRAVTSFLLRFLSPTRGTEGVVKTIEKAWLEVELSLQERRRGRKDTILPSLRFPPQTGEMAPSRVPSRACENRWHNAYKEQEENDNTIFSIHLRFIKKQ